MNLTPWSKRTALLLPLAWLVGVACLVPAPGTDPTADAGPDAGPTLDASPTSDVAPPPTDAVAPPDATPGDAGPDPSDGATSSDAADASPTADAADPSDAGGGSDAATDPGDAATDASAPTCPVGTVDPATEDDVRTTLPRPPPDAGAFRCPAGSVFTPRVFQVTRDTHFTTYISHNLDPASSHPVHLFRGCDPGSAPIFSLASPRTPETLVINPGTYTFVTCRDRGSFAAEPAPAPANTNTSCATAASLPSTGVRMYDPNEVRYFKFSASSMGDFMHIIQVASSRMHTGRARFVVRTSCEDPATEIFDSQNGTSNPPNSSLWTNGPKRYHLPITRSGTHYLVLSEVDPGLLLTLTYSRAIF